VQPPERIAGFRYGAVLMLTLCVAVFSLVAPDARGARMIQLTATSATLLVAMLTSGARPGLRRGAGLALVGAVAGIGAAVLAGAPPVVLPLAAAAVLCAGTIAVILGGLVRLVLQRGVVLQAVLGALAVYLLVGLTFGFTIGALATGLSGDYFAQGTDATQGARLYFSFTTLTTTGCGDLTASGQGGRALAVLEMLTGQLYLVTVIAMLVGNLRRRQ
jgi:hypothetical protein